MTVTTNTSAGGSPAVPPEDLVTVTIDGFEIQVPKGTLLIRAAELLGIQIPRFCDHPLLDPVGACRQCLVEITDMGNGRGMPKPQASCTITVTDGMVVKTQLTSPVAEKAQRGVMEFLLINHPLDCPICDKGGECPLQNQALSHGQGESRFVDVKRTFPKPIPLSTQILLDRERCIQCARCTRFSAQIAGDPFIDLMERGAKEQVGIAEGQPFQSYFSGNTVQICPVGALTGAAYRFRARPFDLVSTPSVCEHCASGCAQRTDHRRGKVTRRLAGDDPQVNEEWNCDKGRWAFTYATQPDRLKHPLVRDEDSRALEAASWPEALQVAARGLAAARGRVGVLTGGRLTLEDAYAYAKFARVALHTNDIDFRARPHSAEEAEFLAARVAGHGIEVTYTDLEKAPAVLLVGFEPEDESPIVFLRLRKAARKNGTRVFSIAPYASRGLTKTNGTLIPTVPGGEASAMTSLGTVAPEALEALHSPGAVILAGERLAEVPGALSAVARLADTTGARLAWVPRRAGDRGAIEAGALPNLLPVGRPVTDAVARAEVARVWAVSDLPATEGRDTAGILAAAAAGELDALVIAGVDLDDLPDPEAARAALAKVPFIVSLELRASNVTDRADVVFPVAAVAEKSGTFVNWEGRGRPFGTALQVPGAMSDLRVLAAIADEMDVHLGLPDPAAARRELAELGAWKGTPLPTPVVRPADVAIPQPGQAVLATWDQLLGQGRMQDGEPHLAGTARPAVARLSAATAAEIGLADGQTLRVEGPAGAVRLPAVITEMPDRVVWLPTNAAGCAVRRDLGASTGTVVSLAVDNGTPVETATSAGSEK
ncbi:NADH-quinone oxidoreductase subunit G [Thermobifida fusca]|jgi:NADH-quinone oxidoreductase subunit G|uniref:NADH-quinone oxidoreductase n=1 Tax=Thermobifida fusca (strain YX) TaxID=269800 RepID=Q47LF0_THEFY|nr:MULTISPECIES: NADH-quinone oxidoreductase subunit G [Thermobifida]AAZ56722.1 NADH-quinone oxidoreductase, chain G [Thermobifida fusca YX]MBO2528963.1 NADH-quinone oxidoreductase subunit G [Thermobifida sp.]MDD6791346.1 NADH-quinone oxidoreductase subunit G [Thermobifida fusca]PPS95296.1 NADH-quinone oxidoreductase subunit G [Thermobifida fusca]PZN66949.1 MAG: NADH-quinone oxidoreductase subunit G [Thermobifida fusca]